MVPHLEHYPKLAIADFATGPIQQSHATVGLNQAILDAHGALTDMIPASEVLPIEERFPAFSRPSDWSNSGDNDREDNE